MEPEVAMQELYELLQEVKESIETAGNTNTAVLCIFIGVCLAGFIVLILSRYIDGS